MTLAAEQTQSATDELKALLGDRVSTNTTVRDTHGKDESWHHPHRPDAVVFPNTTEEVSEVVKICAKHKLPVVAYGTGTCLEGNVIPTSGGVVVDLMNMDQVLRVSAGPANNSTNTSATRGCSFQLTPAPMPPSAAWRPRVPPVPMQFATERCARTYWH
jgi:D-lactate dehydrogenase (cytochrome)